MSCSPGCTCARVHPQALHAQLDLARQDRELLERALAGKAPGAQQQGSAAVGGAPPQSPHSALLAEGDRLQAQIKDLEVQLLGCVGCVCMHVQACFPVYGLVCMFVRVHTCFYQHKHSSLSLSLSLSLSFSLSTSLAPQTSPKSPSRQLHPVPLLQIARSLWSSGCVAAPPLLRP